MNDIRTPRWALPLLEDGLRYLGAHGGRGSGKSHFFAEMLIERCLMKKTAAVCLREIQKSLSSSVKRLLEIKIESLAVGHLFEVQRDRILHRINGSEILFQGLQDHTADSIKSFESFDIFWIEEAQSVSQRSLDVLRPTVRKPGSQIWATWNPNKKDDPIEFLRHSPPKNSVVVKATYEDNPWFNETALREEMEYDRSRDYDKYLHVWEGGYDEKSEARVFHNWKVEEFDTPPDVMFRFGADYGYSPDPSVLIRAFVIGKKLYIDYEAWKLRCEINELPFLYDSIPDSHLYPIAADCSRNDIISYLRNHGYPKVYGCIKSKIKDGVEWLRNYDIIVHPRCKRTIDELQNYCYKIDKDTLLITNVLEDKKNHVIDALRYACEGLRKYDEVKKPVNVVVKPQLSYWD